VLDLSDPGVPARTYLRTLTVQRQAELLRDTFAVVAGSPRLQELATQLQDTFAHLADVGRPLQELADRMGATLAAVASSAEEGRDDRDPGTP